MKKLYCIMILMCTLICVYPCGKKEKEEEKVNIPGDGSEDIEESFLFGALEKSENGRLFFKTDAKTGQNEETWIRYRVAGYRTPEVKTETGNAAGMYVFIRCIIILIKKDKEKIVFINELLLSQPALEPDWRKTRKIEIEGLVEPGMENMMSVVTNWESKSRVSHHVYGNYGKKLEKYMGKIVKVEGFEIESPESASPWNKEILVVRIITP